MMYSRRTALFSLALLNAVRAQVSTASLAVIGFADDNLQGQAVGTGADGTTFVLSGTFQNFDVPFTLTVVQDATHVSQHAVISATDGSFNVDVQCGLDGLSATCTEQVSEGTQATTQIISGTYSPVAVPVVTGSDTFPASSLTVSASASGASITFSSTGSGSGTGSLSVLPAQITVTSRTSSASATVTSGLSESGTSTSGAERVFGAGAGAGAGLMIAGLGMLFSTMFVL